MVATKWPLCCSFLQKAHLSSLRENMCMVNHHLLTNSREGQTHEGTGKIFCVHFIGNTFQIILLPCVFLNLQEKNTRIEFNTHSRLHTGDLNNTNWQIKMNSQPWWWWKSDSLLPHQEPNPLAYVELSRTVNTGPFWSTNLFVIYVIPGFWEHRHRSQYLASQPIYTNVFLSNFVVVKIVKST